MVNPPHDLLVPPLRRCLSEHCPSLSSDVVLAFAVQIAIAERRDEAAAVELHHLYGGRSPN